MTALIETLTRPQLLKLAEEATTLAEWTTVRDFADQVYGVGKAAKVEIRTYGEYDDEGGTDYRVDAIAAYDKDGNELEPDHSLPFFQTPEWRRYCDRYSDSEFVETLRELYFLDDNHGWILLEDLPCADDDIETTYDLTVIPSLSLPS